MPLSICAATVSGFTALPQSIAQATRRTRTAPAASTSTSATCATMEWKDSASAMPRPARSPGAAASGVPQPRHLRRRFEHAPVARRAAEHAAAELERILARRTRHFVEEGFDEEGVVAVPHAAPVADRDRLAREHVLDQAVRHRVRQVVGALGDRLVLHQVGGRRRHQARGEALRAGLADDAVMPGGDRAGSRRARSAGASAPSAGRHRAACPLRATR